MSDDDFVHIGGEAVAGKDDIEAMQSKIKELENRIDELEEIVME
jgi:peptidoglycan hydrolase CwlO-like protein